jgi:nicotinamidase-related amidase
VTSSIVVDFASAQRCATSALLVVVDAQRDYLDRSGLLSAPGTQNGIAKCRQAIAHARHMGIDVAFARWRGNSRFFDTLRSRPNWMGEFIPRASDMIFERDRPSCYASPHFAEAIARGGGQFALAGFGSEIGCLATAIEAHNRGHNFVYLADASCSLGLGDCSAEELHDSVARILGLYDVVVETDLWINLTSRLAKTPGVSA